MNLHQIPRPGPWSNNHIPDEPNENEGEEEETYACECGSIRYRRTTYWRYYENETYRIGDRYTENQDADGHEIVDADGWECTDCGDRPDQRIIDYIEDHG